MTLRTAGDASSWVTRDSSARNASPRGRSCCGHPTDRKSAKKPRTYSSSWSVTSRRTGSNLCWHRHERSPFDSRPTCSSLDELFGERHAGANFFGIHCEYRHETLGFAKLLERGRSAVQAAATQFEEVEIGRGESVRCLKNGVWLLQQGEHPYTVVLAKNDEYGQGAKLTLEIAGAGQAGIEIAAKLFERIERRLSQDSCYRGRVISLEREYQWSGHASQITVHELEAVAREDVIALSRWRIAWISDPADGAGGAA